MAGPGDDTNPNETAFCAPAPWSDKDDRTGEALRARSSSPPPGVPRQVVPRRLLSILTSEERKKYPITSGVLDYFPDAVTMVAHVSYLGNQKHNPGQPLHWARGKSMDHEDCIVRHTIERDVMEDGVLHAANRVWRAMAALQEMLEEKYDLDPPRGAK